MTGFRSQASPAHGFVPGPLNRDGQARYHARGMDKQTRDALRTFLVALAIAFVALLLMSLILGLLWSKVPLPQVDRGE